MPKVKNLILAIPQRVTLSLRTLRISPFSAGVMLALLIGVIAGLGAVGFRMLISFFTDLFFVHIASYFSHLGRFRVLALPAIGGAIVGPLVYLFAREAKGHGVPEVMLAVAQQGSRIRGRVAVVKAFASAVCIGSGGSVGREGPIVQIGSASASFLGQRFGLSGDWLRVLVACGAAGGISATFNAPIAGVFFALEVILGTFSVRNFGVVVLSSVTANAISQTILGNSSAFRVPAYSLTNPLDLAFYAVLGVLACLVGLAFVRLLYWTEDRFDGLPHVPEYAKPILGGLAVGALGSFFPQAFGVGYEPMTAALSGSMAFNIVAVLILVKIAATSLTLGSGGSGGVFAPSLFIGSMTGTAFGFLAQRLLPASIVGEPGAYGLVGMASVFAAAARAPITAVIIVFEMTRDYSLILPLMLAVGISTLLSRQLSRETVYTMKLARRGIDLNRMRSSDPASSVLVEALMTRSYPTIRDTALVRDLPGEFEKWKVHGLPVVDAEGHLKGIVTASDMEHALSGQEESLTINDIATHNLITAYSDQTLSEVLAQIGAQDVGYIPVVDRSTRSSLLGVVRRQDIIRSYAEQSRRFKEEPD